jgi:rhodanese-related sulfurtransferase
MRRFLAVIGVIMGLITLPYSCAPKPKKNTDSNPNAVKSILLTVNDFETKLASIPNAQLVDVRTPGEFKKGFIKGAININYQGDTFMDDIAKLDKNKPTFVYCQLGGRSSESCNYMSNQGFKELYELDGGMGSWTHYNKPVEAASN